MERAQDCSSQPRSASHKHTQQITIIILYCHTLPESSVKQRLMLIKTKAVAVVDYLKVGLDAVSDRQTDCMNALQSIAAKMNEDMEVWIGQHYRQEVDW